MFWVKLLLVISIVLALVTAFASSVFNLWNQAIFYELQAIADVLILTLIIKIERKFK